ncbi:MAG: DUF308 domain-containing protein [Bacteroidales bacterium]|nr:DUF308 domain-containing protein [Bacteroidales bacterium]
MKKAVKNWWISLLIGIIAIIMGVWCFTSPGVSLVGITYVFIVGFLLSGILDIFYAVSNRNSLYGWGWTLAGGILELLLGIMLLVLPTPVVTGILVFMVGFWMLFRSIWGVGEACQLQIMGVRGWGWLLALSIICIILSFMYLLSPGFGKGIFVVVLVGISMLVYGLFRVIIAFQLRKINKELKM